MDPALAARRKAKAMEKKKESGFKFTKEGKIVIMEDGEKVAWKKIIIIIQKKRMSAVVARGGTD